MSGHDCPWNGDCFCWRDQAPCACGHLNQAHGYGDHLPEIRGVSRIGLGACGNCSCSAFTPTTKNGERLTRAYMAVPA